MSILTRMWRISELRFPVWGITNQEHFWWRISLTTLDMTLLKTFLEPEDNNSECVSLSRILWVGWVLPWYGNISCFPLAKNHNKIFLGNIRRWRQDQCQDIGPIYSSRATLTHQYRLELVTLMTTLTWIYFKTCVWCRVDTRKLICNVFICLSFKTYLDQYSIVILSSWCRNISLQSYPACSIVFS